MLVALDKGFASFCTIHALTEIAPLHRSVGCRFGFWVFLFLGLGLVWLCFVLVSGVFWVVRFAPRVFGCVCVFAAGVALCRVVQRSRKHCNTQCHLRDDSRVGRVSFQLCWPSPDPNGRLGAGWMINVDNNLSNSKAKKIRSNIHMKV